MKFFAGLAALASLAAAAPSGAPSPLDVKLEKSGNSAVKAVITNNGKQDLKVFKTGTIFDKIPTEKVKVASSGKNVDFEGVRLRVSTEKPAADDFQHIAAGQSVEVTFDVAQSHNLSSGGKFDVVADGILQFASDADTALVGSVPYTSNTLSVDVDGAEASSVREAMQSKHTKRTNIVSCSSSRLSVTRDALSYCVSLSRNAASAATSGSASKMNEFFKDSSSQTRSYVASVFNAVARECGSTSGGYSDYYCYDVSGYCESNVLAYTVPSQSYMAYCDLYYNQLPTLTSSCHRQDKATTNLHEMTHLTQIAGTDDLGYGYDNIRRLSSRDSLNNADSYAVFANSIYAGC